MVLVSSDPKTLRNARSAAEASLEPATLERVRFLQSEELITYLDELAAGDAGHEDTVRGYKVKTRYKPVREADARARKQAISQVLLRRRKQTKKED